MSERFGRSELLQLNLTVLRRLATPPPPPLLPWIHQHSRREDCLLEPMTNVDVCVSPVFLPLAYAINVSHTLSVNDHYTELSDVNDVR